MSALVDGQGTLITFAENSSVKLYEKTLTPPGISGGGVIDTTNLRNTAWRTAAPKTLKNLTESSGSYQYDPAVYDEIIAMVGVNQLITITFPEGDSVSFYGSLDEFAPGENSEGEEPTASVTVQPTLRGPLGSEVAPSYSAA